MSPPLVENPADHFMEYEEGMDKISRKIRIDLHDKKNGTAVALALMATLCGFTAALLMAMTISAEVDIAMDNPRNTAQSHIEENLQEITELVDQALFQQPGNQERPIGKEASRMTCWEENDPSERPLEKYIVQVCRLSFERNQARTQADYVIVMEDRYKNINWGALTSLENFPIADAYLKAESVKANGEGSNLRLKQKENQMK